MNSKEKDQLLDGLIDLMALHRDWDSEAKAIPYADDDGTFGVRCGAKNGGLYGAYFLMDKLAESGLLGKSGGNDTCLDAAMYTLRIGSVFDVYEGAKLYWNEDKEIEVAIRTDKPVGEILQALGKGMEIARDEHRSSMRMEIRSKEERRADKRRDRMPDVFSAAADTAFVKAYLAWKISQEFPKSNVTVTRKELDAELQKMLNDTRPRMEVTFDHPAGEDYKRFNDFHSSLGGIFNGSCAISAHGDDDRNSIDIAGTPARLTADILDHDTAGARQAAAKISAQFPALKQKMSDEVENRAAASKAVEDARKGTAKDIVVTAPLQIKKPGG